MFVARPGEHSVQVPTSAGSRVTYLPSSYVVRTKIILTTQVRSLNGEFCGVPVLRVES
jgi:hypothetical protein